VDGFAFSQVAALVDLRNAPGKAIARNHGGTSEKLFRESAPQDSRTTGHVFTAVLTAQYSIYKFPPISESGDPKREQETHLHQ
jgi:hypothetical protein